MNLNHEHINDLAEYIYASPTPYHAVFNAVQTLNEHGFTELKEHEDWELKAGQGYYVIRGGSLLAFKLGRDWPNIRGYHIVGSHTDSPCLRVKPQPENFFKNYMTLGVEVYGGILLSTWFDRDLSIAGKVVSLDSLGNMHSTLINFKESIALIPNLAIHLSPGINEERSINKQKDLPPLILQMQERSSGTFSKLVAKQIVKEHGFHPDKILATELSFFDTNPPRLVGAQQDFFVGARLDNLLSVFTSLKSLIGSSPQKTAVLMASDHEEVGSTSYSGAASSMLLSTLKRISGDEVSSYKDFSQSFFISSDNAHGVHPNYSEKHDPEHGPLLNQGPVIKINANQRYATHAESAGFFEHLCQKSQVPVQKFVVRSDMGCGSTIGPITAAKTGISTIDIGIPTFAMHSIRETAGAKDVGYLIKIMTQFYNEATKME